MTLTTSVADVPARDLCDSENQEKQRYAMTHNLYVGYDLRLMVVCLLVWLIPLYNLKSIVRYFIVCFVFDA